MNILVAIDSSSTAHAALAAALARHWPEGSDLRVVTVIPGSLRDKAKNGQLSSDLYKAHRLIDTATAKIQSSNEDLIVSGEIDIGNPVKTLMKVADSWPADLVIVGSHDRSALNRFFMGSVSRSVLHKANCSVLVAKNLVQGQTAWKPLNRVLVAIDDSPYSKAAVASVLATKWADNTRFFILSVHSPMYAAVGYEPSAVRVVHALEIQDERRRAAEEMVEDVSRQFESVFGPNKAKCGVLVGDAEALILEVARDWRAQLIVVGSHGRPDITKRWLGSVSQTIALKADCSVQVVRSTNPLSKRKENQNIDLVDMPIASCF